jgi:hypothetical protein
LLYFFIIGSVLAGDFTPSITPSIVESTSSDIELRFNISNLDSSDNITAVNITIPAGFVLVQGSNETSVSLSLLDFTNSSNYMTWENATSEGFILLSTSEWFNGTFSATTSPGNYTFNISVWHTNGELNYSDYNVSIQDTTPPSAITLITPENDSWISTSSVLINLSYTELNPAFCIYSNTTSNTTNATTSSPCQVFVTGYSEGNWTYQLYVNDTTGNLNQNVTYTLNYDSTDPSLNSLGVFQSGQNVSAENISTRTNVTISVNITDPLSGVNTSAVWANVYNGSGDLITKVILAQANGNLFNGSWDTGNDNSGDDVYTIHVNGTDEAGNTPSTGIETTLELLGAPDLTITNVEWNSNNALPGCPTSSNSITFNVTIENIGDSNFTGTFNITTDVDSSEKDRSTLDNTSLDEGESMTFNITLLSSNFSSNKYYSFGFELDPEDAIIESSESNNTYSLGFNLGYNISMHKFNGVTYPSVGSSYPDSNVTVNISVQCGNGTGKTDLNINNLQFFNNWGSDKDNVTNRIYSFSHRGGGYYAFTFHTEGLYTSQNRTRGEHGDNYLNVTVISGSYYSKGILLYNITAPDLSVVIDIDDGNDFDLADNSEAEFNLTVTNNGNAIAYDIWVDEEDDWLYPDHFLIDDGDLSLASLDPGESHTFADIELVSDETDDGDEYNLFVYVHYNDSASPDNEYEGFDKDKVEVTDSTGSGDDDDGDDGGTTGGDTGGELDLELTLMDWDDEIQGYAGEDNTTRVEVKNTGDVTVVAKVSFTCSVLDDTTIAPLSKSLAVGSTQEFIINFDLKDSAEIGEYDCTVKAYVSSAESNYDTETTVIKILPTAEQAEDIEGEFDNITIEVQGLLDRFALINQALVNEDNYTRVKNSMDNLNETLQDIADAIEDGDYISANELIQGLQASILTAGNSLDDLELEQGIGGGFALSGTWYWVIIIIVVVVAVAFVAYLLFPQKKGYGPKRGLLDTLSSGVKGGTSKIGDIKDSGKTKLSTIAEKGKPFTPTQPAYGYKKGPAAKIKSAFSKLKEKLKRKKKPQKEVTQYFVNSSSNIINYS